MGNNNDKRPIDTSSSAKGRKCLDGGRHDGRVSSYGVVDTITFSRLLLFLLFCFCFVLSLCTLEMPRVAANATGATGETDTHNTTKLSTVAAAPDTDVVSFFAALLTQ